MPGIGRMTYSRRRSDDQPREPATQHGPAPDRVQVAEQAVHGLLRHLESACFLGPARTARRQRRIRHRDPHLDRGHASGADGRANVVPETGLRQGAQFLRRTTTTVIGYPRRDQRAVLRPADLAPGEIIWHGDFGP